MRRAFFAISFLLMVVVLLIGCKEEAKYKIEYDLDGGFCDELVYEFTAGENIIVPYPVKVGHEFIGWLDQDGEFITGVNMGAKDYYLTAKWEPYTYKIYYNLDGGVCDNLITSFKYGESVTLPTPTKEGYEFVGWYENFTLIETIENDNYHLLARWEKESYEVNVYVGNKILCTLDVDRGTKFADIELQHESLDKERFNYVIKEAYFDEAKYLSVNLNKVIEEDCDIYVNISVVPVKSYEGLKVSVVGDSISTFYSATSEVNSYYHGTNEFYYPIYSATVKSYTDTWWWKTIVGTNTTLGINNSWSGTAVYNNGNPNNSGAMNLNRINTLDDNEGVDVVLVFMGTNDCVNGNTSDTFKSSYNILLTRIHSCFPNAYVLCFTLGYSAYSGYNYTDTLRLQYNEVIKELAVKHNAGLIDLAKVQTTANYQDMLGDSLHPSLNGMNKISECAIQAIKDYFTKGFSLKL